LVISPAVAAFPAEKTGKPFAANSWVDFLVIVKMALFAVGDVPVENRMRTQLCVPVMLVNVGPVPAPRPKDKSPETQPTFRP